MSKNTIEVWSSDEEKIRLSVAIQPNTVDTLNEYLANNHDKTEYNLSFFIINAEIHHNYSDFNIDNFKYHGCHRIGTIEDAIYKFLYDYIVEFKIINKFVEIVVTIKEDRLSNTLTIPCENYYHSFNGIPTDEYYKTYKSINMNDKFDIDIVFKNET
jgi:hypothetical protein